MFYRIRQFVQAFFPLIYPDELLWARQILPPRANSLFLKQSKAEQRHALTVAQNLLPYQTALSSSEYQDLITAALLHDCGKSLVKVRLWQRVFIVLMQQMPGSIWTFLQKGPSLIAAPLNMAEHHAHWGSSLAQTIGLNSIICNLIHEHHTPTTKLGQLLYKTDNEH
ncbi:HD domain-containing protein [Desulfosporosinus sp. FKA]|uniref:HD domain-containing protein n=1 Tax=Desulfosporosinus sp. FKA TaxID=1969834 RepID=UPI000B499132|nr:HD domain-containing protein [Desulfosporosinus sp. FKA]